LPATEIVLEGYPRIKMVHLEDVNHYEMFLMEEGSKQVAELIYGAKK
jgi:hypothetical protein